MRPTPRMLISLAVAGVVALLASLCLSFGLIAAAPAWTVPLLVGVIVAAATGADWLPAAAGTGLALALVVVAAPPWFIVQASSAAAGSIVPGALFVLVGAASAGVVAFALGRMAHRDRAEWVVSLALVAAIVGGMWATTSTVNAGAFTGAEGSLDSILAVRPELGNTPQDSDYYLRLFYDVHDSRPYYDSVAKIWLADPLGGNGLPIGVTSYRLPTIFYLWKLLPRNGDAIPWAFLCFATLAVGSGFSVGAQLARPGPAVLGALALATAYFLLATSTWVTFVDGWGMALTLAGIALFVASVRKGSRGLLWAAIAAFVMGALVRELLVYPIFLGAASVLLLPKEKRWHELWPWLMGLALFAVVYVAHVLAIAGRVSPSQSYEYWLQGGTGHLWATLEFFSVYFGGKPWLLPALVVAGTVGALLVWRTQKRLSGFLAATIVLPLAAFLVLGNAGRELATGEWSGYWGVLVVPIALALVPVAIERSMQALGMTAGTTPTA